MFIVDLDEKAVLERWDRIYITCHQPFKRGLQFGLAFLRFYTTDAVSTSTPHTNTPLRSKNITKDNSDDNIPNSSVPKKTPAIRIKSDEQLLNQLRSPAQPRFGNAVRPALQKQSTLLSEITKKSSSSTEIKTSETPNFASKPSHTAALRFRSALNKLCNNTSKVSPTAVAKQKFLSKFGAPSCDDNNKDE